MSLHSMTGHGRAAANGSHPLVVEISSVNRRQLDVQASLPRAWAGLEARIVRELGARLGRGRVSVTVWLETAGAGLPEAQALEVALEQWRALGTRLGLKDDLALSDLLHLSELEVGDARVHPDEAWALLQPVLQRATDELIQMRAREGAELARALGGQLDRLQQQCAAIAARAPFARREWRDGLYRRLTEAELPDLLDDERVLKEVALFAERSDISEECTRLESHLAQAREKLQQGGVVGRSLDFLCQELNREINTIGAKCNDATIAREVIAFKTELEKVREQVQNLE